MQVLGTNDHETIGTRTLLGESVALLPIMLPATLQCYPHTLGIEKLGTFCKSLELL